LRGFYNEGGFTVKIKTTVNFMVICLLVLGALTHANAGGKKEQTGKRGLAVEDLPHIEADIEVFPQLGNGRSWVKSVAFSPDGKQVITGSNDFVAKLWDVVTGREIRTFNWQKTSHNRKVQDGGVLSVTFSPDGKQIISASYDKTIKLWDIATGNEIRTFSGHTDRVESVAFSPDGKQIISASDDKTIKLWDVVTGREIRTFSGHTHRVESVAFSPDGRQVLSGSWDHTVKLWDAATGSEIRTFTGHTSIVNSVAFSPDGKQVLSGCYDKTIKLWDTATGNEIRTFSGHTDYVLSVAFSPDGKQVLSGCHDKTIKLWDVATGSEIRTFTGHILQVETVAFSPDGKQVLSGAERSVKLWDTATGQEIRSFTGHTNNVNSVAISPDGLYVTSCSGLFSSDNTVKLWDITTGRIIRTFAGHTDDVFSVKFSPNGNQIISVSNGTIKLWDIATGREIRNFNGSRSVAFSPDGKQVVIGSEDYVAKLWDVVTGREIITYSGRSVVYSLVFSPDGNQILSCASVGIVLYNAVTGMIIRTFGMRITDWGATTLRGGHEGEVTTVAFSPDGTHILSGSEDNTIKLWDTNTGNLIRTITGHTSFVNSVAFSPDGRQILSGSSDNTVKLWDAETGNLIRTFAGHTGTVNTVAFISNYKQIVSGSDDRTIRLWDLATGKEIATFVSFTGSDSQLAAVSRGLTVETQTATASNEGEWLTITPDGYYNASPRGDRYINVRINNIVSGIDAYRSILYNPDVVQARLQGRPDPKSKANVTIQQAASFTPPEVVIQSPTNFTTTNTATTNLSVAITSQSQPIKNIKILVNGRLIGKDELTTVRGKSLQPERASLTVTGNQKTVNFTLPLELEPGNNRIEVVAFNGYSENRRYVDVTRNAPAGERPPLPNLWVVAVGVNGYDNAGPRLGGMTSLNFAVADAKGLVLSLKAQEGRRYAKVNSMLIADGEQLAPTAENIRQAFKFLEGADPRRDVVALFLAGHGISAQESKFFFLPKDAAMNGKNVDTSRAISGDEIMTVLDAPGNRLVFIDACQSGGVDNDRMVRSLMDTNAFVFAASRGNELSYESRELGHGFFTHSIMSALGGAPAALSEGRNVSVLSMSGFVKDDVPKKTGGRQNPSAYSLGFYDFPMAIIRQ
jgi:WD40 repeat protein